MAKPTNPGGGKDGGINDIFIASAEELTAAGDGNVIYDGGTGNDTLDVSKIPFGQDNGVWVFVDRGPLKQQGSFIRSDADFSVSGTTSYDQSWSQNFKSIENLTGGDGNDLLVFANGTGDNILHGGAGNDYLSAADGNDQLFGGDGDDFLVPGWGSDTMTGGSGNDTFQITGRVVGQYDIKTITDFDTKVDESDPSFDQIWLAEGWSIDWTENSNGDLKGYLMDGTEVFGEIVLLGLTLADAGSVPIQNVDSATLAGITF